MHVSSLHLETAFDERFQVIPNLNVAPTELGMKTIAGRPGYEREVEFLIPCAVRLGLPIVKPGVQLVFWVVPVNNTECQSFHAWFLPRSPEVDDHEYAEHVAKLRRFVYELDGSDEIFSTSKVNAQDKFACASQGLITDRSGEHLGSTDVGVLLMRKLFREGIKAVAAGQVPRGLLLREPRTMIDFPHVF